jgi:hypothetical protein
MQLDLKEMKPKFSKEIYEQMKERKKLMIGVIKEISLLDQHYHRQGAGDDHRDDDWKGGKKNKKGNHQHQREFIEPGM